MATKKQRAILKELEQVAGKYNKHLTLYDYSLFVWRRTVKGARAGDWNTLLILADKARDLECEVFFITCATENYNFRKRICLPCPERFANGIAVYIPA